MSDEREAEPTSGPEPGDRGDREVDRQRRVRQRAERRRRLAEVFGDGLPEQTRDDREPGQDPGAAERRAEWLRRQRPPHHGG